MYSSCNVVSSLCSSSWEQRRKTCYSCRRVGRERTELRHLRAHLLRARGRILTPALADSPWSVWALEALTVRSQIAPAQTPFAADCCPDYTHQADPGGVATAEIIWLELFTRAQWLRVAGAVVTGGSVWQIRPQSRKGGTHTSFPLCSIKHLFLQSVPFALLLPIYLSPLHADLKLKKVSAERMPRYRMCDLHNPYLPAKIFLEPVSFLQWFCHFLRKLSYCSVPGSGCL